MLYVILILFLTMNLVGLSLMGVDKKRAIKHGWRIKEKTLWLACSSVAAPCKKGATAGMHLFHHKTRHLSL